MEIIERFTKKYTKSKDGCWQWIASKSSPRENTFYGVFNVGGKVVRAHRFSYELYKGKIPTDMVVDHICRNTLCVNPEHLRVLTSKENILIGICPSAINKRRTSCIHGHLFDKANTMPMKGSKRETGRRCRKCKQEWERKHKRKNKA